MQHIFNTPAATLDPVTAGTIKAVVVATTPRVLMAPVDLPDEFFKFIATELRKKRDLAAEVGITRE